MAYVDDPHPLRGQLMLKLETKLDLDRLIEEDIQESLTLDYKDAQALEKTDRKRNELCKDVSAFANSAGGQIIYGIQENGHHPVRVQDADAVSPADISREWVEQVIDSNVQPRIQNLRIHPIDVALGRVAYVITIPQATINAPHQAPDNKYYYRQNFQSVPMEDYQVRDTMRRTTTPELYVRLSLPRGKTAGIEFAYQIKPRCLSPSF
jgi:predicted HTH transcriptional regulator